MSADAVNKSEKLNQIAQEKIRLLSEVDKLSGERDMILRNRENYDSQELELRSQISVREATCSKLKIQA